MAEMITERTITGRATRAALDAFLGAASARGALAPSAQAGIALSGTSDDGGDAPAGLATLPERLRMPLANPHARLLYRAVTCAGIRQYECYGLADGEVLALTPEGGDAFQLAYPADPLAPVALAEGALGLGQSLPDAGFACDLDMDELWVLAAFADALRQNEIESLLARAPPPPVRVRADMVYLRLLDGASLIDPRWLSPMLACLFGPAGVREDGVVRALASLLRKGLLQAAGEDFAPADAAMLALANLQVPLAAISLSTARLEGGAVRHGRVIVLRSLAALWLIEPDAEGQGVRLASTTGEAVLRRLKADIAAALVAPVMLPAASAPPRFCAACGGALQAGQRFCGACGAPVGRAG